MNKEALAALATETARHIKTPQDLSELTRLLTKTTLEAALHAELEEYLAQEQAVRQPNSRNGYSHKQVNTESGTFDLATPRDRQSRFESQLVEKRQTRVGVLDDHIISLYAKGMSTRDIVAMLEELYGANVSPTLISKVTDAVMEQVTEWQAHPLEAVYPIVYLDTAFPQTRVQLCIVHMVRNSLRYVSYKDYKRVTADLKLIYRATRPKIRLYWRWSSLRHNGTGSTRKSVSPGRTTGKI